jgi:hypothetical protein
MEVAQREQLKVANPGARLMKTRECPAARIHHDGGDPVDPDEISG